MKKLSVLMAVIVCSLVFSIGAKAQDSGDYFIGKWKLVSEGTPGGDAKSTATLERKEGKLVGTLQFDGTPSALPFTSTEEKGESVTLHFLASGTDVYFILDKKDADHVTGTMMDMFDTKGERVVEKK